MTECHFFPFSPSSSSSFSCFVYFKIIIIFVNVLHFYFTSCFVFFFYFIFLQFEITRCTKLIKDFFRPVPVSKDGITSFCSPITLALPRKMGLSQLNFYKITTTLVVTPMNERNKTKNIRDFFFFTTEKWTRGREKESKWNELLNVLIVKERKKSTKCFN